jgi:plastocyanin
VRPVLTLAAAVLALAACAPTAPAPATAPAQVEAPSEAAADCTKASKVTINDDGSFSPTSLKLQRGAFIAVTNKSDSVHPLTAPTGSGLVKSVLDRRERQVIQFPAEGDFTITSGKSSFKVAVAGESGCDAPQPTVTIKDGYVFTPAKISVQATMNFTVVNRSAATHSLLCDPDPGGNRDNTRLEKGETEILAFDKPGTYACHSVQHPAAKMVVTVNQ